LVMINDNYYQQITYLVDGIVTVIAVLIYLILLNWQLLIVIVLMVGISLVLPKLIAKPLQKATKLISDQNQAYLDTLNEWLSGLEQIRQFLAGAKLFAVTEKSSKQLEDATVKQTYYIKLLNAVNGIVS
ncbi:ABC transporter transmembrane domain-containing protein, partial [Streptomyces scabiei]